jgi:hypothetical protein
MSLTGDPIEDDYWLSLEFRVSREFPGMADKRLQHFWCDGFTPGEYLLSDPVPRIVGRTWIADERNYENWEFTLFLGKQCASRAEIDWPSLLPPENVTCWIAIDHPGKRIHIEPSAAVPDLTPLKTGSPSGLV